MRRYRVDAGVEDRRSVRGPQCGKILAAKHQLFTSQLLPDTRDYMQDAFTLLFTSAGRRNQLMDCFRQDAALLGVNVRVLAADLRPELSSACRQANASFAVPPCSD